MLWLLVLCQQLIVEINAGISMCRTVYITENLVQSRGPLQLALNGGQ